jgi:hypothetical protein
VLQPRVRVRLRLLRRRRGGVGLVVVFVAAASAFVVTSVIIEDAHGGERAPETGADGSSCVRVDARCTPAPQVERDGARAGESGGGGGSCVGADEFRMRGQRLAPALAGETRVLEEQIRVRGREVAMFEDGL